MEHSMEHLLISSLEWNTCVRVIIKQCSYRLLNTRTGIQIPGMCCILMPYEFNLSHPLLLLLPLPAHKMKSAWLKTLINENRGHELSQEWIYAQIVELPPLLLLSDMSL